MAEAMLRSERRQRLEKLNFCSQLYDSVNWMDNLSITLTTQDVERIKRGVSSPPSDVNPDLIHVGCAHSVNIHRSHTPSDVYVRTLSYSNSLPNSAPTDQLYGPAQKLVLGRMRVLVTTMEEELCACGVGWEYHGDLNAQPLCWQGLGPGETATRTILSPIHILYDDEGVCLVKANAQPLYLRKVDLTPTNSRYLHRPTIDSSGNTLVESPSSNTSFSSHLLANHPTPPDKKKMKKEKKKKKSEGDDDDSRTSTTQYDNYSDSPANPPSSDNVTFTGNINSPFLDPSDVDAYFASN